MKNKKHIVIDARIRTISTGRPVTFLLENLQVLDKENRYTILINKDDSWKPFNKNFTVKRVRFKVFSFNPLIQILYSIQLYKLRPDLVHFTFTGMQPVLYFGKQTTFTHDLMMLNIEYIKTGKYSNFVLKIGIIGFRFLLWFSHLVSKQIIVPTHYVSNEVKKYHKFTSKKISISQESGESHLNKLTKKSFDIKYPFILTVGIFAPNKNIKRLISAFEILKKENQDLKLVLVGIMGAYSQKLIEWAKSKDVYQDIIFTNYIEDEELKWLYKNAEVYVFPSLGEGFGLTTLEAMSLGCPVLSSDATCLPEVNGKGALYFNPLDIYDITNKIKLVLLDAGLRESLIKNGYENSKRFSWKKMSKETLEIFNKFL